MFQVSFHLITEQIARKMYHLPKLVMDVEIAKSVDMSEESIYGLVLSYFKFNGFEKTSQSNFLLI